MSKTTAIPRGLPWNIFTAGRLAVACTITVLGLASFNPIFMKNEVGPRLLAARASYLSERRVEQTFATNQVKVRFKDRQSVVVTYVYPSQPISLARRHLMRIYYEATDPRIAYYAGPGGDAYEPPSRSTVLIFNYGVLALGCWLIILALNWQFQVVKSARYSSKPGQRLTLRWKLDPKQQQTVIASSQDQSFNYSWHGYPLVLPRIDAVKIARYLLTPWASADPTFAKQEWPTIGYSSTELRPHRWIVLRSSGQIIVPLSRAEPVVACALTQTPTAPPSLLRAHLRLLGAYAEILNRINDLPKFVRPPGRTRPVCRLAVIRTLLCWRRVIRFHVESHIRRQLRQLTRAYTWQEFSAKATENVFGEHCEDMSSLRTDCETLSASLSTIGRPIGALAIALTVVAPILPIFLKTHPLDFGSLIDRFLQYIYFAIVASPMLVALACYADSFRCKRSLFGAESSMSSSYNGRGGDSVYRLEDDVFAILGSLKAKERANDLRACTAVLIAWAIVGIIAFVIPPGIGFVFWILLIVTTFIPGTGLIIAAHRRWQEGW